MSHHLDGLTAKADPRLDISDVYVFPGATGTVFVMATNPGGSNGFHPDAVYDLKIDIDGDCRENFTFRVTFGEPGWRKRQHATLSLLSGPEAGNRHGRGTELAHATTGKAATGTAGIRFWAGPAGDPFYIAGPVVTAVRAAVVDGSRLDLGGFDADHAVNLFADGSVYAIVVEIPDHFFKGLDIGFWGAIAIPNDAGDAWHQTDRAAIPLTSTLFGFNETDRFNATEPVDDRTVWGPTIERLIAGAVAANGYEGDAQAYAAKLRERLSPEILPYRIGTEARFTGGQFNGRNLVENVAEEMFRLVLGRPVPMGLDAASAAATLLGEFPYLGEPV